MSPDASNFPPVTIQTTLSGVELLSNPILNKGTAFTEAERDAFDLHGLLPPRIGSLEVQVERRMLALRGQGSDLDRYVLLRDLQDGNETLFYATLTRHIEELLPIVYTPTVGLGCQHFSQLYRKPRGIFLSLANKDRIRRILANPRFDAVEAIVVTDGERILGLGDQGAGGMGISIGKLALYTACAGLHPTTTLPVFLDVGTDNEERLADPLYIGARHRRVRGAEYDAFVDAFVEAVIERWPHVLLQWEDFARDNAGRLLDRYRDRLCTFNDDIQGTAAIAVGTLLSAIAVTGVPLVEQRVCLVGAGSAGCGIAGLMAQAMVHAGLSEDEARSRFFMVDRDGLLVQGMNGILPFQAPFAQDPVRIAGWKRSGPRIGLYDVAHNARPTVLIGVSGQPGAFDEVAVREMAAHVARPVIFPLSNPTSRAEATPTDLLLWTAGRAVIGTGSPFPPVPDGARMRKVDQTNNSYIFPGVGLGAIAVRARRISDGMLMVAAETVAATSPARNDSLGTLLPQVQGLRDLAFLVARAVALQAQREGLADDASPEEVDARIRMKMWEPRYPTYERPRAG